MKKIILLLCFIFFVASPTFAGDEFFKNGQFYHNKEHYFSVTLPKGWSIEPGKNPHVVLKSFDETKALSFSITVVKYKPDKAVADYTFSDMIKAYHSLGKKPDIIESGKINFKKCDALWGFFTISTKGVCMANWQIITFRGNRMYSIQYGAAGGESEKKSVLNLFKIAHKAYFTDILKSFSFESWVKYDF